MQDRLRQLGDTVWPLLNDNAVVYVCGSTHVAEGVRGALRDLHRERSGSGEVAAARWLAALNADGRYLVDVWASS